MERDDACILFFPVHQHIPRCIAAAVINNDDLEVLPALAQNAVQASIQVPCPVPDGDNDADKGAVFHGVHLLWGKRFGKARRTGALIAFWVEGCIFGYCAFCRRGFASAEAPRGQWKRTKSAIAPLTPSARSLPCCLIFIVTGETGLSMLDLGLERELAPCVRNDMQRKRMKSTSAVSSIRIIANRRESVKEA